MYASCCSRCERQKQPKSSYAASTAPGTDRTPFSRTVRRSLSAQSRRDASLYAQDSHCPLQPQSTRVIRSDARSHPIDSGQHGGGLCAPTTSAQPRNENDHPGRGRARRRRVACTSAQVARVHGAGGRKEKDRGHDRRRKSRRDGVEPAAPRGERRAIRGRDRLLRVYLTMI